MVELCNAYVIVEIKQCVQHQESLQFRILRVEVTCLSIINMYIYWTIQITASFTLTFKIQSVIYVMSLFIMVYKFGYVLFSHKAQSVYQWLRRIRFITCTMCTMIDYCTLIPKKNMKYMVIKNVILEKGDTLLLSSEHRW